MAAQLLRNGKYERANRKSTRLVSKEAPDRWRTPTATPTNISCDFTEAEFAAALQNTKPGKTLGPGYMCPELIIHARNALKSWLCDFLFSSDLVTFLCLRHASCSMNHLN